MTFKQILGICMMGSPFAGLFIVLFMRIAQYQGLSVAIFAFIATFGTVAIVMIGSYLYHEGR